MKMYVLGRDLVVMGAPAAGTDRVLSVEGLTQVPISLSNTIGNTMATTLKDQS